MKTFNTLEELHKSCISFNEVFEKCPMSLRLWRLSKGYIQFSEHCDWSKLGWEDWRELLSNQPQL